MTAHNLDREAVKAFQPPQWKPAQCANGRHYFDTRDGKIVNSKCRCGQYDRRRKMMR